MLKLVSFQGLHLHEGGDGDSLIRGELGVLGGLEKILNINSVKDWCDTYIISLESEVITGTTCYGQKTRSRGAALTSTLAPFTVLVNDLKHIRVLKLERSISRIHTSLGGVVSRGPKSKRALSGDTGAGPGSASLSLLGEGWLTAPGTKSAA